MKYSLAVLLSLFAASANSQLISKKESLASRELLKEVSAKHEPRSYVIRNVTLLSMKDSVLEKDQDVLIENGIIQKIGVDLKDTDEAIEINGEGKFLMPGLTDMHVHLFAKHPLKETWMLLLLINGVTTVRDMNGEPEKLSDVKKIANHELLSPFIYQAGPIITGSRENFMVQAATPQQGRE